MAAFLEDPRLRQRWNQISHNAEAVTENAAAGIWTFQHIYVNPCLASVGEALDSCTAVCLGDREDRARRQRERARGAHRSRAEYSFDFYDDWYDDFNDIVDDDRLDPGSAGAGAGAGAGATNHVEDERATAGGERSGAAGTISNLFGRGFFGSWSGSRSEDWDRLLAGSGSTRGRHHPHQHGADGTGGADGEGSGDGDGMEGMETVDGGGGGGADGEVVDQPRRGRGMSYSTRGALRRKQPLDDDDDDDDSPTIIPSTAPLGFLSRLPWKIGGTLRYKPSAANLREHPTGGVGGGGSLQNSLSERRRLGGGADMMRARDENEPLLGRGGGSGGGRDDYDYQGQGRGARRGLLPWENEMDADDASRQYGTANLTMAPLSAGGPTTAARWTAGAAAAAAPTTSSGTGTGATTTTTTTTRQRSGTTGSGETSDSFRSRGDLFPSDEEDDEDAVPLDDEFAMAFHSHTDDRSSGQTRFSSSSSLAAVGSGMTGGSGGGGNQRKGKKRADTGASGASAATGSVSVKGVLSRSVSRTTMGSFGAAPASSSPRSPPSSIKKRLSSVSLPLGEAFDGSGGGGAVAAAAAAVKEEEDEENVDGEREDEAMPVELTAEQLREEDERAAREEDAAVARRREAAVQLARERGLAEATTAGTIASTTADTSADTTTTTDKALPEPTTTTVSTSPPPLPVSPPLSDTTPIISQKAREAEFVPARLPRFN